MVGVAVPVVPYMQGGQPESCTMCQFRACADRGVLYCTKLVGWVLSEQGLHSAGCARSDGGLMGEVVFACMVTRSSRSATAAVFAGEAGTVLCTCVWAGCVV